MVWEQPLEEGKFNGDTGRRITPVADRPSANYQAVINTFAIGQEVESRYKVLSLLGRGGMGSVYLVEDSVTKKVLALKTISSAQASESALRRFRIEAEATSLLDHSSLIKVHDFGLIEGEHPYFVMDFCEGQTLAELIKSHGPLPPGKALDIFLTISRAVAYAHAKGVVHRDLKPSNIMITSSTAGTQPEVKILDFGIAKVFRDETAFNTLTRTGEIIGSPYYMSPEQCLGRRVDSRSDIYSLGCVFFETLSGCPPFIADNPLTTMLKHQSEPAPSLKEVTLGQEFHPDLEKFIATMLAKDPAARHSSLELVIADIVALQRGTPLGTVNEQKSKTFVLDKRLLLIGVAVLTVLAGIFCLLNEPKSIQMHVRVPEAGWPSIEALRKKSSMPQPQALPTLYSAQVEPEISPSGEKQKLFVFPTSIGLCGWGDDESKFSVARGKKILRVPLSLTLLTPAVSLAGFRKDEVGTLKLRGVMHGDSATNYIAGWTKLRSLDLGKSIATDACIANLKKLQLSELNVAGTEITGSGLRQLPLNHLRSFTAGFIPDAHVILPKLASDKMQILRMAKTGVVDADLKTIGKLSDMRYLDLRYNDISDAQLDQLRGLSRLRALFLAKTKVTSRCIDLFRQLPALVEISVSTDGWPESERRRFEIYVFERKLNRIAEDLDSTK